MSSMKIATLGWNLPNNEVDNIPFKSEYSLLDYDIVIFDISKIIHEYETGHTSKYRGHTLLSEEGSVRLHEDVSRRSEEIIDFVKSGKTLIIFSPIPDKVWLSTGKKEYDEFGGRINIVQDINVLNFLPEKMRFETTKSFGKKISFNGDEYLHAFWNDIKNIICYKSYFKSPVGKPFLYVKGTKKPVGTWINYEKGNIVFIPHLIDKNSYNDEIEYSKATSIFTEAIINLNRTLSDKTGRFQLPEWTNLFILPGEKELLEKIVKEESQMRNILEEIEKKKQKYGQLKQNKILLSGSKIELQKQVLMVLKEIGLEAKEGPEKRDDIIFKYKDKIGIAEIKGKSKSAAEKDAAQLEKWVSEYYSKKGVRAKGFLIVNAYCETPLNKRIKPTFPSQMIPYCKNRDHCLISTSQLLNILIDIKSNPNNREKIFDDLFLTSGVYEKYKNYEDFLIIEGPVKYSEFIEKT